MAKKITISVRTHIDIEDIKDLLDSASRGSNYWADASILAYESGTRRALTLTGVQIDDNEDEQVCTLNLAKIKRGLTVMAKKQPSDFADFIAGNGDNNTGDTFLQCCLFGEVKYG